MRFPKSREEPNKGHLHPHHKCPKNRWLRASRDASVTSPETAKRVFVTRVSNLVAVSSDELQSRVRRSLARLYYGF